MDSWTFSRLSITSQVKYLLKSSPGWEKKIYMWHHLQILNTNKKTTLKKNEPIHFNPLNKGTVPQNNFFPRSGHNGCIDDWNKSGLQFNFFFIKIMKFLNNCSYCFGLWNYVSMILPFKVCIALTFCGVKYALLHKSAEQSKKAP